MDYVVRREGSQITRGRGRPGKTIRETKKDPKINELEKDMVLNRTLWCCLIHVADLTWRD